MEGEEEKEKGEEEEGEEGEEEKEKEEERGGKRGEEKGERKVWYQLPTNCFDVCLETVAQSPCQIASGQNPQQMKLQSDTNT